MALMNLIEQKEETNLLQTVVFHCKPDDWYVPFLATIFSKYWPISNLVAMKRLIPDIELEATREDTIAQRLGEEPVRHEA